MEGGEVILYDLNPKGVSCTLASMTHGYEESFDGYLNLLLTFMVLFLC